MKAYIISANEVVIAEIDGYRPQLCDRRGTATIAFEEKFEGDVRVAVKTHKYQVRIGKVWAKRADARRDDLMTCTRRDGYWFIH